MSLAQLNYRLYVILDHILPSADTPKHDTLRLECLSACKIMEDENCLLKILPQMPASIFDSLLQSVIYKCYLNFISIDDISMRISNKTLHDIDIAFPESLRILIVNWPQEELVLRNKIPPLQPPVEIFQNSFRQLTYPRLNICTFEPMLRVFHIFCSKLVHFIMQSLFKCTPSNTQRFSSHLSRLDLSGLGCVYSLTEFPNEPSQRYLRLNDILDGIRNSKINTFGHKIEITLDADVAFGADEGFECLSDISKEIVNPNVGIDVYFRGIYAESFNGMALIPSEFYNTMALVRCKYIELECFDIDKSSIEYVCKYLKEIVSLRIIYSNIIETLDFLRGFKYLEQVSIVDCYEYNGLINSICNLSKGLKYLTLYNCKLNKQDFETLAKSINSDTLMQLDISCSDIENDPEAVGLSMLCQNLKNVKVLTIDSCSLYKLSSTSASKLINAFNDCDSLEYLSLRENYFCAERTNMIIDGLAEKKLLRYLSLSLPEGNSDLIKPLHDKLNKFRHSPIYISWYHWLY